MKNLLFAGIILLLANNIFSQIPKSFKYQAVVRDASGQIVANKVISLRLSILQGQENGPAVYSELHEQFVTSEYGIAAVEVGRGAIVLGNMNNILWDQHSYYLKVELDINGQTNFVLMGTSQILAVPYALYALDVVNNNDADADPSNEIQDLQLIDNVLKITRNSNATEIPLSQYIGVDTDEQQLSVQTIANTVQLSIQRGNTVSFNQPTDFVSKSTGGTFNGNINANNIQGNGVLSLQGNFSLSGTNSVQLTSSGPTTLTLPVSGTLATEGFVSNNYLSKSLLTGRILVGEGGFAVPLDAYENGHILIGNGVTLRSRLLSGDASISNLGVLTVSRIGNIPINLGGNFSTGGAVSFIGTYSVNLNATGTTNLYLPQAGTLASEGYVSGNFMPLTHPSNGISSTNITNWNAAYSWGNHAGLYRLVSYVPSWGEITSNPFSFISPLNNQLIRYNNGTGRWENWTPNYLSSFTETDPVYSVSAAAGISSANITNWNAAYSWGNHAGLYRPVSYVPTWDDITSNPFSFSSPSNNQLIRYNNGTGRWENWTPNYLTSFTETDPVYGVSAAAGINSANITNWNVAYSWGNHALAGYLTSYTETDPVFGAHVSSGISGTQISNWNTAHGWGNHALAGYLTSYTETDPVFGAHVSSGITSTQITDWNTAFGWGNHATAGYLTSYTETDPVFGAHVSSGITGTQITNWNSAFGWGNHASAGYLTSYTETDPVFGAHVSSGISGTQITNWNTAYGWGNHASIGYLTSINWASPGAIGSSSPNSGSFTTISISDIIKLDKTSRPLTPDVGTIYFDNGDGDLSRDGHVYIWDGSVWRQLTN